MNTHDVLAYTVAREAVRQIRHGDATWSGLLGTNAFATSSRVWPVPDFVIVDVPDDSMAKSPNSRD